MPGFEPTVAKKRKVKSMNSSTQLRTSTNSLRRSPWWRGLLLIPLVLASFALPLRVQANDPQPDGSNSGECIPPPDGLVSWWAGDGDAGDIYDLNDLTAKNGATFGPGIVS